MKTIVYVDGFNLYYRALHRTRFKWLNLKSLADDLLGPRHQVVGVRYYTARISGRRDPGGPRRQQLYLNALGTVPEVSIHFGHFLDKVIRRPLVNPPATGPRVVDVYTAEEKGSDVNLATHVVHDAWSGRFEAAAVISNDTDLEEPIRVVTEELGRPVGVICPKGQAAPRLAKVASFVRHVTKARLRRCQFPDVIRVDGKTIVKPTGW